MSENAFTRRGVLAGAAGLAAAIVAGCKSGSSTSAPSPSTASHGTSPGQTASTSDPAAGTSASPSPTSPAYVPFPELTPDLPGTPNGVPAAFFSYPKNPTMYAKVPIGAGDAISVLTPTNGSGTPKSNSAWWQNLQDILQVDIDLNMVPGGQLGAKQQAMLAGGDIPDIAIVNPNTVPLGALDKYFTDLSPYLAGDAVKEYPALAAIPSLAWKTPTIDGKLFGVPQPRIAASYTMGVRKDLLDKMGITVSLADGKDLLALFKELADPQHNHWAYGQDPMWLLRLVLEMYGVPNGANAWSEDNGKFTSMFEAPATKDAISVVAGVWKDGYMHPDSAQPNSTWFPGGVVYTYISDFSQFSALLTANDGIEIELVPVPRWDGGGLAVKQLNAGAGGNYGAYKKAKPERIKELLRLADYLAAPVGTQEFLAANYGKKDVSYTFTGADPVLTPAGNGDHYSAQSLGYVSSSSLDVLYTPGHADFVKAEYDFLSKVMAHTYFNPSIGLYSPTNVSAAGLTAAQNIQNTLNDILQNRKPISAWDAAVKSWRDTAGNKMRSEYEEAFPKAD
jgi:putative aldouronate transport system substrate-binding protein